jgi:hypothetical protein
MGNQLTGIHDALRIECFFHSAKQRQTWPRDFTFHPWPVFVADRMVMCQGPTVAHEGFGDEAFQSIVLLQFMAFNLLRREGEVKGSAVNI